MNKNRLLTGFVIVLLLVNSAALIYMWRNHAVRKRAAVKSPAEYLIQKTGMDSIQKTKYYELVKEHRKATRRLKDDLKEARELYFSFIGKPVADSSKQAALQKINQLNTELSNITFDHFTAVRSLCNKDQQIKFDAAIEDVLNMMAGPPPPPPPGGERPDGRPQHDGPPHNRPMHDGPPEPEDAP